jgi:hypothetical protein
VADAACSAQWCSEAFVIDPAAFRMVELLTREDLEAHPVWADFHEDRDRDRVLAWGVAPERLEAELRRYDYCGRAPLYPVLVLAEASELASPTIAVRVTLADGRTLQGYRVGDAALGVYVGDDEVCLNPSLPGRARAERDRLAALLGLDPAAVASLVWETVVAVDGSGRRSGALRLE